MCRLDTESVQLRRMVAEQGSVREEPLQNSRGQVIGTKLVSHPCTADLRRLGAEAQKLCDSLGLSPDGRRKLGILADLPQPEREDDLSRLQDRRRARRDELMGGSS